MTPPRARRRRLLPLLVVVALTIGVAACSDDTDGATAPPASASGRTPWGGFSEERITVSGPLGLFELCVLLALTGDERARGLMDAPDADLGGYDGMLFVWDADHVGGFWMLDTEVPLSIAWFDAAGALVGTADMAPCGEGETDCPSYDPGVAYRAALEVPEGSLDALGVVGGAVVERSGQACAPAV